MAWYFDSNSYDGRFLQLGISETVNKGSNSSTLSWYLASAGGNVNYYDIAPTTITINGTVVYSKAYTAWSTKEFPAAKGKVEGTIVVPHGADGKKTCSVSFTTSVYVWTPYERASSITLTNISTYTLSTSATNSSITVNRTSSGYSGASTGNLSSGARLYYGDKLTVSFSANSGYALSKHTVNDSSFTSGGSHTVSKNVSVVSQAKKTYTLTISADAGSTITVNRTSSAVGSTGNLSNNATIYADDVLKITFAPKSNYSLVSHTVNSKSFTSGSSHTVSGNVSVGATSQPMASTVTATNAKVGDVSKITITKYNSSYYHTLEYSIGGTTYYIQSDGSISNTATKFSGTTVNFTVPSTAYTNMSGKSRDFNIDCKTYGSNAANATQIGSTMRGTFAVYADESDCLPIISGTVTESNSAAASLCEGTNKVIQNLSVLTCSISITPRNGATITKATINGTNVTLSQSSGVYNGSATIHLYAEKTVVFSATDSRGYTGSSTTTLNVINYVPVTCNPTVKRPSPASDKMYLTVSGNYWGKYFQGEYTQSGDWNYYEDRMVFRFRYKKRVPNAEFTDWGYISKITMWHEGYRSDQLVFDSASSTYYTPTPIELPTINLPNESGTPEAFSYRYEYEFEIEIGDYTITTGLPRSSWISYDIKTIIVPRGVPVFNWGKNDFEFNVPVAIGTSSDPVSVPLTINGAAMDYIEAQGVATTTVSDQGTTSNATWIYRKWHSGIAECWCRKELDDVSFVAWGTACYSSQAIAGSNIKYPTFDGNSIFVEQPILNVSLTSLGSSGQWAGALIAPQTNATMASKDVTGSFGVMRGAAGGSSCKYIINYHAIGKWKVDE